MSADGHAATSTPFGTVGRLDLDEEDDRLLCHFCGRWYARLAHHIVLAHEMTPEEYRTEAGLSSDTPLWSPGQRAQQADVRRARNFAGLDRASPEAIRAGLQHSRIPCARCGEPFARTNPHQVYCETCGPIVVREYGTDWKRKKRHVAHPAGESRPCEQCGVVIEQAGPRQRYCAACARIRMREQNTAWARRKREADRGD